MQVTSVEIKNVKSVPDSGTIHLSPRLNVLLGRNNAGKSILINSLFLLQQDSLQPQQDIRFGEGMGEVRLMLRATEADLQLLGASLPSKSTVASVTVRLDRRTSPLQRALDADGGQQGVGPFPTTEPNNVIYPFLSKRKVVRYEEQINEGRTVAVAPDFTNLYAKVDRLSNPDHRRFAEFRQACQDIIGFTIGTLPSPGGKKAGINVGDFGGIALDAMGEGVPHLLALVADLCIADRKIFLLEEPENDLHPEALKKLLELIIKKSEHNQFIVATHSNIVARYLGSQDGSKTIRVAMERDGELPRTQYLEVGNDPAERREVLRELGYEMNDLDLWDAWVIFEESSAERFVMSFLVPQFVPRLINKLGSVAAGGIDGVEPKFNDFNRLFLFTHRAPIYRNRTWVLVDAGPRGDAIVRNLQAEYRASGWLPDHFRTFSQADFERYYPAQFQEDVTRVLAMRNGRDKQDAKKALLDRVVAWIAEEPGAARRAFEESAQEVIAVLKEIEAVLIPQLAGAAEVPTVVPAANGAGVAGRT